MMATTNTSPIINLDENAKRIFTLKILEQHYTKSIKSDLYKLVELLTQPKPIFLKADNYKLLINPTDKCVLTNHITEITNYFSKINENVSFDSVFYYETLDPENFEPIYNEMCENDTKRHSLISVLWRIYNEIIPIEICQTPHKLLLKIKQMPNFSEIPSAHECTSALLSSCMLEAKTLAELEPNFNNINPNKLRHIFLLSLLSGIVDVDLMADSFHKQQSDNKIKAKSDSDGKQQLEEEQNTTDTKKRPMLEYEKIVADTLAKFDRNNIKKQQTENKGSGFFTKRATQKTTEKETAEVSRAKKTGFFARLLNKLVN